MHGAGHVHGSEYDTLPDDAGERLDAGEGMNGNVRHSSHDSYNRYRQELPGANGHAQEVELDGLPLRNKTNEEDGVPPLTSRPSPGLLPEEEDDFPSPYGPASDSAALLPTSNSRPSRSRAPSRNPTHSHHPPPNPQKALLQCLLLEAGILFHSVFIGMALSVSTGPPFVVLLIAISFHQTFEGLALGSRIAALVESSPVSPASPPSPSISSSPQPHNRHSSTPISTPAIFPASSPRPWLMALAYGTTTPLGQALGLLIHRLYDPRSAGGLLAVGIMNAVSSGLLLFAGLVELLAEDFLSDRSYAGLRGRARWEACASVVAGGLGMAVVGAWA
ncbi:MAG: hypothetical protein M1822_002488 [Bathelium mastoideum]|nr:MAG: hypothetical protein M1822_002488 [Bathelium mastoideum]